ncbi:hypothetical protein NDU88_008129 [Pleurodeles waltl]|uniref:Uncharacterized protein n=1 Tax=Pleurodeles waltl TaxID=8319 RepID=A0AAV7N419_PLEWA|nr:hypothetical protein NDU88_008129 [Pleurodeles waltl]
MTQGVNKETRCCSEGSSNLVSTDACLCSLLRHPCRALRPLTLVTRNVHPTSIPALPSPPLSATTWWGAAPELKAQFRMTHLRDPGAPQRMGLPDSTQLSAASRIRQPSLAFYRQCGEPTLQDCIRHSAGALQRADQCVSPFLSAGVLSSLEPAPPPQSPSQLSSTCLFSCQAIVGQKSNCQCFGFMCKVGADHI